MPAGSSAVQYCARRGSRSGVCAHVKARARRGRARWRGRFNAHAPMPKIVSSCRLRSVGEAWRDSRSARCRAKSSLARGGGRCQRRARRNLSFAHHQAGPAGDRILHACSAPPRRGAGHVARNLAATCPNRRPSRGLKHERGNVHHVARAR